MFLQQIPVKGKGRKGRGEDIGKEFLEKNCFKKIAVTLTLTRVKFQGKNDSCWSENCPTG